MMPYQGLSTQTRLKIANPWDATSLPTYEVKCTGSWTEKGSVASRKMIDFPIAWEVPAQII